MASQLQEKREVECKLCSTWGLEKMFLGNFEVISKIHQLMVKNSSVCCSSIHFIFTLVNFYQEYCFHMFTVLLLEDFGKINQYAWGQQF